MARKVGIPFTAGMSTHGDATGLAATISGFYRPDSALVVDVGTTGVAGEWTPLGAFSEVTAGYYVSPVSVEAAGLFQFMFISTDPRIGTQEGKIEIVNASVDDVKAAIDAAQLDITDIKSSLVALDGTALAGISTQLTSLDTQIALLTSLVDDTNNPAILSLRELLTQIQSTEATEGGLIGTLTTALGKGVNDIEAMLRGDEFLSDGTTANALYGNSNIDIMGVLLTISGDLTSAQAAVVSAVNSTATTTQNLITTKVAELEAIISANQTALTGQNGLEALSLKLDTLIADIESTTSGLGNIMNGVASTKADTAAIINTLGDATNGLAAINTAIADSTIAILTKLTDMTTTINKIDSATTDTQTRVANAVPFVSVIM